MALFVDGYNLAFKAGFDKKQTEAAREKLLSLLAKFKSVRSERIVVFFDGGPEAANLSRFQREHGMEIFFSDARSDADSDIKTAVSHDAEPRAIRVITSDAAIRRFVERYGATVTDSATFLQEVQETLKENSLPEDEPLEKYEGAAGEDADYWMRVFGGEEGDGE